MALITITNDGFVLQLVEPQACLFQLFLGWTGQFVWSCDLDSSGDAGESFGFLGSFGFQPVVIPALEPYLDHALGQDRCFFVQ